MVIASKIATVRVKDMGENEYFVWGFRESWEFGDWSEKFGKNLKSEEKKSGNLINHCCVGSFRQCTYYAEGKGYTLFAALTFQM